MGTQPSVPGRSGVGARAAPSFRSAAGTALRTPGPRGRDVGRAGRGRGAPDPQGRAGEKCGAAALGSAGRPTALGAKCCSSSKLLRGRVSPVRPQPPGARPPLPSLGDPRGLGKRPQSVTPQVDRAEGRARPRPPPAGPSLPRDNLWTRRLRGPGLSEGSRAGGGPLGPGIPRTRPSRSARAPGSRACAARPSSGRCCSASREGEAGFSDPASARPPLGTWGRSVACGSAGRARRGRRRRAGR